MYVVQNSIADLSRLCSRPTCDITAIPLAPIPPAKGLIAQISGPALVTLAFGAIDIIGALGPAVLHLKPNTKDNVCVAVY